MTIDEFFNWIKELSKKPKALAYYSNKWFYRDEPITIIPEVKLISCGNTTNGLLRAIYGGYHNTPHVSLNSLNTFQNQRKLHAAALLKSRTNETFIYTYMFCFEGWIVNQVFSEVTTKSIDHIWLVIMYKSSLNSIRYRFFQSYVTAYSLAEYLETAEKKDNYHDLSEDEFDVFCVHLAMFSKTSIWTSEMENFYQTYFKIKTNFNSQILCQATHLDNDILKLMESPFPIQINIRPKRLNATLEQWEALHQPEEAKANELFICPSFQDPLVSIAINTLAQAKDGPHNTTPIQVFDIRSNRVISKYFPARYLPLIQSLKSLNHDNNLGSTHANFSAHFPDRLMSTVPVHDMQSPTSANASTTKPRIIAYRGISLKQHKIETPEKHPLACDY